MTSFELLFIASLLCAVSGVPALFSGVALFAGRRIACCFILAAAACGLFAAVNVLLSDRPASIIESAWQTAAGAFVMRLDGLSAFFVIPVVIVGACISIYGCGYCATTHKNRAESIHTFFFGLILSAVILILMASSAVALLVFWEVMALSVFIVMCLEHGRQEVRDAGLQYLIASHVTILAIIVLFSLLSQAGGTGFPGVGTQDAATPVATVVFFLALLGFGLKAGIMPLHVWLPAAHANAPSNISALMSGIILKMGIYGIIRVLSFYAAPPLWWGILLLCLGIVSAVAGVLFAIGQHDLKRLLAYHSIENIGIIVMGIGVAMIGLASGNRILFVLGMAGGLLHVLNHALFKSLLFLGAGAVIHVSGTREIDRMGGLSRALPFTSVAFLVGSVAICGLPPLNGFVSELLIYLGLFKGFGAASGNAASVMALATVSLAITGGLAVACFVKVFGSVFLGSPRSEVPEPHEHPAMTTATGLLGAACIFIGVLPFVVVRLLEPVIAGIFPQKDVLLPSINATANVYGLSAVAALMILLIILIFVFYLSRLKSTPVSTSVTWDCGYLAPSSRMQYSASSFADMLVGIFSSILRPETHEPVIKGLFPGKSCFTSHVPEVALEKGIIPFFLAMDRRFSSVRRLQSGQLNRYLLYIFIALIVLLAISGFQ